MRDPHADSEPSPQCVRHREPQIGDGAVALVADAPEYRVAVHVCVSRYRRCPGAVEQRGRDKPTPHREPRGIDPWNNGKRATDVRSVFGRP